MASSPARSGFVQTVTGPVAAGDLGLTLPHEHVYIQQWDLADRYDYAGQLDDDDLLYDELMAFRRQGGRTIVDLTVRGIGRQPARLRAMAERTGIQFVVGCGWYRGNYYPPEDLIDRRSVDELAALIVEEIVDGIDGTGVRPGIIGEVGTEKSWVSAQEERVHRAAARAQRATGLALTTHSIGKPVGLLELKIFEEEGVDLDRVVIGHCDHVFSLDLAYHLEILRRGAYVEFDTIGAKSPQLEDRAMRVLLELLDRGHVDRLLLSQDVCKVPHLCCMGGGGFAHLLEVYLPRLRAAGVPDDLIERMTVENPRRLLAPP
jgi:predicted metal-dependent phosphotriesterase family hydrolase